MFSRVEMYMCIKLIYSNTKHQPLEISLLSTCPSFVAFQPTLALSVCKHLSLHRCLPL